MIVHCLPLRVCPVFTCLTNYRGAMRSFNSACLRMWITLSLAVDATVSNRPVEQNKYKTSHPSTCVSLPHASSYGRDTFDASFSAGHHSAMLHPTALEVVVLT